MGASSLSNASSGQEDLQRMIQEETLKAQYHQNVSKMASHCFDICCSDKPSTSLSSRQETCLANCTERFIDVSMFISQRFMQRISHQ